MRIPVHLILFPPFFQPIHAWLTSLGKQRSRTFARNSENCVCSLLSNDFLENDLVSVQNNGNDHPRLCVVRPDATVAPLCLHEDDVETDLFLDPRCYEDTSWQEVQDDQVREGSFLLSIGVVFGINQIGFFVFLFKIVQTYGEGWYGQRPVPSLGGGPGYGAMADEIWSIDEELLSRLAEDKVQLPILDVGIAHGEKARGGSF